MTVCRWCGLGLGLFALVVAGTQLPVFAQEKDEVKWKAFDYNKDKKEGFYQTLSTKTTQTMKVQSQQLEQKQDQTFFIQWIPEEKTSGGNWVVKQKIIGVQMNIDIGGNKITYDSIPEGQPQNPLSDFFKKLMTLELTFTIKPDLTVEKIDGRDKFIEELSKVSPQMKALLEKILSEKALIAMADPAWAAFPPGGNLKQKDGWSKKSNLDLGPIGIYDTTFTYKHAGKADKNEKIDVTSTLTYSKPTAGAGLPFVIKDGKLTSTDGKGTVEFNRDKGRIEKSSMTMKLTGDLTIEVGGMSTKVELEQNQTASSTTSDTNPVDELRKKEKEKK